MESLSNSSFVLGFGWKYVQTLAMPDFESEFWDSISSSATTLLCIFQHNVSTSVLSFPSYFNSNANSVNSQNIGEYSHTNSDGTGRQLYAALRCHF